MFLCAAAQKRLTLLSPSSARYHSHRIWNISKAIICRQYLLREIMRYCVIMILWVAVGICGPARADWDAAMIARQRGDLTAAYSGFEREAQAGATDAQAVVGEMLFKGQGVPKDEAAGLQWLRRASDGGSVVAMLSYGSMAF